MNCNAKEDLKLAKKLVSLSCRCSQKNLKFNLTIAKLKRLSKAKRCFYTGLVLDDNTRTIDRIDNLKGYEDDNVVPCHSAFNLFKSNAENNPVFTLEVAIKGFKKLEKTLKR